MMKTRLSNSATALALLCLCFAPLAYADAKLEDFSVMATGALDGRAVVKSADGKMHVLKVGDALPGTQATVLQVLADKLVVEESVGKEGQPKVKQTAWIFKSDKPGGPSAVQRFDTQGPAPVWREVSVMNMKPSGKKFPVEKTATKPKAKAEAKSNIKPKAKTKTKDEAKAKEKAKADTKKEVKQ